MGSSNLPPGVTDSMIPGNRPEDDAEEAWWDEYLSKLEKDDPPAYRLYDEINGSHRSYHLDTMIRLARDMGQGRGYNEGVNDATLEAQLAQEPQDG